MPVVYAVVLRIYVFSYHVLDLAEALLCCGGVQAAPVFQEEPLTTYRTVSNNPSPWLRLAAIAGAALLAAAMGHASDPGQQTQAPVEIAPAPEEPLTRVTAKVEVVAPPIIEGDRVTQFATQVTSVSTRQIEDLGAGDLASALRRMPGVTISRYNLVGGYGGGDGGAIFIRGQGSGRPGAEISTLIDGIPRFVGVWTHPLLDTLPVDMAERIDVYKSAQPVGFGNMAFAGINLVPKAATREGTTTRVVGAYGEHATSAGVFEHGARLGRLDYFLTASQRRSEGHREDAGGRVRTLYGRLGYEVARGWNLNLQVHSNDAWADDPGRVGAPRGDVVPRFGVDATLSILTLTEEHGNHSGSLKLYHDDGSIDWLQWDAAKRQAFTTLTDFSSRGAHLQERFRFAGRTELVVGLDHDTYGGSTTERRPTSTFAFPELLLHNTAGYATVARTFGQAIEVTPSVGVRYTDSRDFGGHWGGQAGLVVRYADTVVHANLAKAFNLPGVYTAVMYRQWNRGDTWKDLQVERLNHAEVGLGQQLSKSAQMQLTVFRDRVTDALRFVPPPPPPPSFANLGNYTIRGAEASLRLTPRPTVALFAGATYLDATPSSTPNAPRWSLSSGLSWQPVERVSVTADAEWVDTQAVLNPRYASSQAWIDSYFLLNVKTSVRLPLSSAFAARLFVSGENLTDSKYEYRPGYPAPGRTLSGGLELWF